MKRGLLAGLALAACQSNADGPAQITAATATPTETQPRADYIRTTLIVRDMEASLALYRDALGLALVADRTISTAAISAPSTGEPGAAGRFAMLRGPDTERGMLGLIQWTDPPMPDPGPYPARLSPGSVVLVMRVADAADACGKADAIETVTVTKSLYAASYPKPDGSGVVRSLGCTFFDPDGNLLELSQRVVD